MSDEAEYIVINVKPVGSAEMEVLIEAGCSVLEMKEAIRDQYDIPVSRQRLILAGRVLVDELGTASLGIVEGTSLHLALQSERAEAAPVATERGSADTVSVPMVGNVSVEQMRRMSDNPMMQGLMQDTDLMREMLYTTMPGLKQAAETNSDVAMMLSEDALNQMGDLMRNPDQLRQLDRSVNLQRAQISHLGAERYLDRAMQQAFAPFDDAVRERDREESKREAEREANRPEAPPAGTPVPNPWTGGAAAAGTETPQTRMLQQLMGNPQLMQRLMRSMGGAGGMMPGGMMPGYVPAPPTLSEEQLVPLELEMQSMGFIDREANIAALRACGGDVAAAVARVLGSR